MTASSAALTRRRARSLPSRTTDLAPHTTPLSWITVAPGVPYFQTDDRRPWHPIGQNDAISWYQLNGLFRRRDLPAVREYLQTLVDHGVTCLRLMLEYAQVRSRYIERSPGNFNPPMVRLWDDLFALCEEFGLRILLTPFDTFWMWLRFQHHPYNARHGGPLSHPSRALLSPETRAAIKARLTFAAERWGGSGALFAWDLWNEIHPAQAEMSAEPFHDFIEDLSTHVRSVELRAHGRAHPQTVSLFGPELTWRPHLNMEPVIFRHPALDFANLHIYAEGTIDHPRNTVDPAIDMGRIVRSSLAELRDTRPFFDSEHGPIHTFKDKRRTLPAPFDDEYFRHMQWAHLASGGAGGGMRWPNRRPHSLTAGMRGAQLALSRFLPSVDWLRFRSRNITPDLHLTTPTGAPIPETRVARFACASSDQAVVYLLRRDTLTRQGQLNPTATPLHLALTLPTLIPGNYRLRTHSPTTGDLLTDTTHPSPTTIPLLPLTTDLVLSLQRLD